jgi:hypothetical protein
VLNPPFPQKKRLRTSLRKNRRTTENAGPNALMPDKLTESICFIIIN